MFNFKLKAMIQLAASQYMSVCIFSASLGRVLCSPAERSKATQDVCIARAQKIFEPFKLEFGYVDWFSVYQIGQRVASAYTLDHKVFLAGDATCVGMRNQPIAS